ncbi:J domain-containing protein [Stenoxybacter acetivorans]|uniref:J domain-containing protein n=1 Tax=Stenoxybacter acetivorans TaxID=422441 RepID=UPI00056ACA81|nr:J domain-containing protein [Stenoxybacter acetivorans]
MNDLYTHYDTLGVAKTASAEVIRAAYRALSQKYHPDRNPDNASAHDLMSGINEAYAVLSDEQKRREYDVWLARRQLLISAAPHRVTYPSLRRSQPFDRTAVLPLPGGSKKSHSVWWWIAGAALLSAGLMFGYLNYIPTTADTDALAVKTAPNGQAFPLQAAYVSGYPILAEHGDNLIRVDSSSLNTAVFAQLFELRDGKFKAIRSFYLPAGGIFDIGKIGDGDFSLHYQRLDSGEWQVSDTVEIRNTEKSRQYREIEVRL